METSDSNDARLRIEHSTTQAKETLDSIDIRGLSENTGYRVWWLLGELAPLIETLRSVEYPSALHETAAEDIERAAILLSLFVHELKECSEAAPFTLFDVGSICGAVTKSLGIERNIESRAISLLSKKGLDARHAESRAIKADAEAWWLENRHNYKTKEAAAYAMAGRGKVVDMNIGVVRRWITEWSKKHDSTGNV